MEIHIQIVESPMEALAPRPESQAASGALAEFWGTVRDEENGARISALHYESYDRMAEREIERLLRELGTTFPCERVCVIHRKGWVAVKEAAIYVGVQARHRREAFGLLAAFMDRLKQDVPIWKTESKPC